MSGLTLPAPAVDEPLDEVTLDLDRGHAGKILVCFGSLAGDHPIPPYEWESLTRDLPTGRILVRDLERCWYHAGTHELGANVVESAESLIRICRDAGADRVVTVGASAGAYAALLFGALIGADEVHAFSPQTFIDRELRAASGDDRWEEYVVGAYAQSNRIEELFDLQALYQRYPGRTAAFIHYSPQSSLDDVHARRLGGLPGVELLAYERDEPIPADGHGLTWTLRGEGTLPEILASVVANESMRAYPTRPSDARLPDGSLRPGAQPSFVRDRVREAQGEVAAPAPAPTPLASAGTIAASLDRVRPFALVPAGSLQRRRVLVVGVYLANRPNTVRDTIASLASDRHEVTQRWIGLGGEPQDDPVRAVTSHVVHERTPKYALLNRLLAGEDLATYDYVLVCDDDVVLPRRFLDHFLPVQERLHLALAQPARTPGSFIDHEIVTQRPGVLARRTRFVEIGPVVSVARSAFGLLFPHDEANEMGWGFENVWTHRLEQHGLGLGIVDAVPVDHSLRPPVENYDWGHADAQRTEYLAANAHLPLDDCMTVLETIPLAGASSRAA